MSSRPVVFLSYSHSDKPFAEELLKFLRPFERTADFRVWSDREIKAGSDWQQEIAQALDQADVAILLVSQDYLASEWIQQQELPQLLRRHETKELRVLPIIIRPATWVHTPLAYYQVWPRDGRAISELPRKERDRLWTEFTEVLVAILHGIGESPPESPVNQEVRRKTGEREQSRTERSESARSAKNQDSRVEGSFFISHAKEDGDFAENLKSRMAEGGFTGWVDIDVLEAGTDWRKEIDEAILASCAVILVLSPDSKASEYVTYEWAYGLGLGLRVVPLLLRETPIHPRLEAFQYLDFTNRRARPWDRLFALLHDLAASKREA